MGLFNRLAHAFNAFVGIDPPDNSYDYRNRQMTSMLGPSFGSRPDLPVLKRGSEKSIVSTLYNKIAVTCSEIDIRHVRLDENDRYIKDIDSYLNDCLKLSPNIDQTAKMLIKDTVLWMLEEGVVAVCPVETTENLWLTDSYDIKSLRAGRIVNWYPQHVQVELYNEKTGNKSLLTYPKSKVAIIENPLYSVINGPGSLAQRLIRKLALLDTVDEQMGSGKLDMIIQLPYVVKSDLRREQAETRRKDIENQLNNSKYGIAYTDGTEKITQLNRPVENNVLESVKYLTSMLYSQLGYDESILNNTADEKTLLNFMNNTIQPIMDYMVDEMSRKLLSKTARSQRQKIMYFKDPFKLVPITNLADIADKFTRNEIMSSNEMRQVVGLKPVQDELADELRNKNINAQEGQTFASTREVTDAEQEPPIEGSSEESNLGEINISDLMSDDE